LLRRARAVPWQGQIDNGPNWPDAKHKAQLAGNRAAADLVLEADKRTALDKARPGFPYPAGIRGTRLGTGSAPLTGRFLDQDR
jgi:hypothetical protein